MLLCSTVRVWESGKCAAVLEGHGGAVQAVRFLPSGEVVTGSNDSSIRVWAGAKCAHIIAGHTDTVRCGPLSWCKHRHGGDSWVLSTSPTCAIATRVHAASVPPGCQGDHCLYVGLPGQAPPGTATTLWSVRSVSQVRGNAA